MKALRGIVIKVGGSILKDGRSYVNAAVKLKEKVEELPLPPIVVVSAMKGVTDALLEAYESRRWVYELEYKHLDAARYIGGDKLERLIAKYTAKLKRILEARTARDLIIKDAILSFGETLSKLLLVEALRLLDVKVVGIDAREVIKTSGPHGRAYIDYRASYIRLSSVMPKLLIERITPVIEGFIGSTSLGVTTTLGRGGSDYTATTIAALLGMNKVNLVTDVPGIMSADPKYVASARVVPRMSFKEAVEAAYYGCKGLHPRTFHPLMAMHSARVMIGGWEQGTEVNGVGEYDLPTLKLVTYRSKGKIAYVALVGGGVHTRGLATKMLSLVEESGLHPKGVHLMENRPSMVLSFAEDEVKAALNVLHTLVLEAMQVDV